MKTVLRFSGFFFATLLAGFLIAVLVSFFNHPIIWGEASISIWGIITVVIFYADFVRWFFNRYYKRENAKAS